jgi:hypothetical protein
MNGDAARTAVVRRSAVSNRVIWLNRHFFPIYVGFCPSVTAWKHAMKKLDMPDEEFPPFANMKHANVTTFEFEKRSPVSIITFKPGYKPSSRLSLEGLMLHECVHVWQRIRGYMGEKAPSAEFEAYTLQDLWQQAMVAYDKTLGRKRHRGQT